ncbi:MAG: amino acid ABC transporter permease [Candidatus Dormibacteraeota bacterium]|nr:amino acid ABC transporter permease [Candidatus Dormibacteraeota bacterium]
MAEPAPQVGERLPPEAIKAIPVRHPWRWVAAVVVLAITAQVIGTVVTAPDLHWEVVGQYLFNQRILQGVLLTLLLTVGAMLMGIILGTILAVMRLSPNPVVSTVSWFYIWFFRGTPVLVQIFFWFNLNTIIHHVGVGIPFTNIGISGDTNTLISPFLAVLFGLGFNEAAYMAEIVRAGIISVEQGQTEAAQALGMRRLQVMQRIVLPQAMRVIIPPTGNETISMLKTTSLAIVVGSVAELATVADQISTVNYRIIELFIVISLWYLLLTSILTFGQYYIERYYARGAQRQLPPTPLQRFRRLLFGFHAGMPVEHGRDVVLPVPRNPDGTTL